jgi:hypothetical protein
VAAVSLSIDDLTPFASIEPTKAQAMIDDALALAARVAPCILEDTFTYEAAAKAILRGAILRWHEAGTGALQSQQAGPYGMTLDTRQQRRGMFWPSEIEQLQDLCKGNETSGAFSIDTFSTAGLATGHAESCALNFGATYCSCGYALTQELPLYGA